MSQPCGAWNTHHAAGKTSATAITANMCHGAGASVTKPAHNPITRAIKYAGSGRRRARAVISLNERPGPVEASRNDQARE